MEVRGVLFALFPSLLNDKSSSSFSVYTWWSSELVLRPFWGDVSILGVLGHCSLLVLVMTCLYLSRGLVVSAFRGLFFWYWTSLTCPYSRTLFLPQEFWVGPRWAIAPLNPPPPHRLCLTILITQSKVIIGKIVEGTQILVTKRKNQWRTSSMEKNHSWDPVPLENTW